MKRWIVYLALLASVIASEWVTCSAQSKPLSTPELGVAKGDGSKKAEKPATAEKDNKSASDVTVIIKQENGLGDKRDKQETDENVNIQRRLSFYTGALALVGLFTFLAIIWQSCETRKSAKAALLSVEEVKVQNATLKETLAAICRQADLMERQTGILDRQILVQESAMQQWVNLVDWKIEVAPESDTGMSESLAISFKIVNGNPSPLWINMILTKLSGGKSYDTSSTDLLIPGLPYLAVIVFPVANKEISKYVRRDKVSATVICTVIFTDSIGKKWEQVFTRMISGALVGSIEPLDMGNKLGPYDEENKETKT
ncbi:MAG: hypothetical protein ABSG32_22860 [Terriglobia bacterium]|jgi:hypothetical protein